MSDFTIVIFTFVAVVVVSVVGGFFIALSSNQEERKFREGLNDLKNTNAQLDRIKVLKQYHHDPEMYSDKSLDDQEDYLEIDDMAYFYQLQDMKKRRGGR